MMRRVCVGLLIMVGGTAIGATTVVSPSEDVFMSATDANRNFGGAGSLEISATGLPKGEFQSLVKFNFAGAKASFDTTYGAGQWSVMSVTLQFTTANPINPIFNANAAGSVAISWMANDSWVQGTGTPMLNTTDGVMYSTYASFLTGSDEAMGTIAFAGGTSGTNVYSLTPSAGFLNDITSGGLGSLRFFAGDATVSALFNAQEFTGATMRPVLTVNAVPEPGVGLIAMGLTALGGLRRRRVK